MDLIDEQNRNRSVGVRMVGGLGGEVNIPRASRLPVEGNNTSSHHQPFS